MGASRKSNISVWGEGRSKCVCGSGLKIVGSRKFRIGVLGSENCCQEGQNKQNWLRFFIYLKTPCFFYKNWKKMSMGGRENPLWWIFSFLKSIQSWTILEIPTIHNRIYNRILRMCSDWSAYYY